MSPVGVACALCRVCRVPSLYDDGVANYRRDLRAVDGNISGYHAERVCTGDMGQPQDRKAACDASHLAVPCSSIAHLS